MEGILSTGLSRPCQSQTSGGAPAGESRTDVNRRSVPVCLLISVMPCEAINTGAGVDKAASKRKRLPHDWLHVPKSIEQQRREPELPEGAAAAG